jgi:hypothetical protein
MKRAPMPTIDEIRRQATQTLMDVAADAAAPPAARAAASRTLLESLGDIGRLQAVGDRAKKPMTQMSLAELDEEIARRKPRK